MRGQEGVMPDVRAVPRGAQDVILALGAAAIMIGLGTVGAGLRRARGSGIK
jgi:hypothetical protein